MIKKNVHLLLIISILFGYVSLAQSADRGPINSGETKIGINLTGASYMDTWTFQGNAGDRVIINAATTSGTLDTRIMLYPPDGGPAEADSYTCWGSCWGDDVLDHQLAKTGLYTMLIRDYDVNSAGEYNVTFLKIPGAISSAGDPDGGAIASGETKNGAINVPSDMDAFQFYGNAGDRVIINAATTSGTLDTRIMLYPPDGGPAEADSYTCWGSCWGDDVLDHQLAKTGLYTIVIRDYDVNSAGTYNISLSKIPPTIPLGVYNPSPANGATLCDVTCSFSWNAVTGATGYDIFFGEDVTQPFAKIGDNLVSPSMFCPTLETGKIYYWHVVAHTSGGDIQGPDWWFRVPAPETGWFENFESYNLGTFPYLGDWFLVYDGGHQSSQYVDNAHAVSDSKSLRLVGSSGFPAGAFREVGCLTEITLEADIFIDQIVSCGIRPAIAAMNLRDLSSGATFGGVRFNCDGKIYAVKDNIADVLTEALMSYTAGVWYHVQLSVDSTAKMFDVYIDGILCGAGIPILNSGMPTGVFVGAGYGANPTVWFDDVKVGMPCAPPSRPIITDPGSSVGSGQSYSVCWSSVGGATSYDICEATNSGFTGESCTNVLSTCKTYSHTNGTCTPVTYYYRVRANNNCGSSSYSTPPVDIQVNGNITPGLPTLVSPPDGATNVSTTPTLDWTDVSGATSYDVQVCSDSSCSQASVVRSPNVTSSQWTVTPALSCATQYWGRARAKNACGDGPWSTIWSFTTMTVCGVQILIPNTTGHKGCNAQIPVNVNEATGIAGFQFTITYNSSVLTCTDAVSGSLTSGWTMSHNDTTPGQIIVGGFDPTNNGLPGGSGSLVSLVCTVVGNAGDSTILHFADSKLKDKFANEIPSTTNDGTFTVVSKWLGDLNNDGNVDIADVILDLRIALKLDPPKPCADINGDGIDDIADVILKLRMALKIDPLKPCGECL